jgi:4'-phosphopantetheinyl transferase
MVSPLPAPDETHLWRVRLDITRDELARFAAVLSEDEVLRAKRFLFERDRDRFVAMLGQLREVLATYVDCTAADLAFGYGLRGKPRLVGQGAAEGVTFSVSHTGSHALIGIAREREIGVDLEEVRPNVLGDAEAALLVSADERRALWRLEPRVRERALFSLWVQKRAYAKARGATLARDLRSIDVDACDEWSLRMLDVGPDFAAALVVEGPTSRVRWSPSQPASSSVSTSADGSL